MSSTKRNYPYASLFYGHPQCTVQHPSPTPNGAENWAYYSCCDSDWGALVLNSNVLGAGERRGGEGSCSHLYLSTQIIVTGVRSDMTILLTEDTCWAPYLLCAFAKLWKRLLTSNVSTSFRPSTCPHRKTRFPPAYFNWNCKFRIFKKSSLKVKKL